MKPEIRAPFAPIFTPKLVTCLREGYGLKRLAADAVAGLTVAIVALPLAMGIAIASGATPAQGLFTAIVAGLIISAFGGSRFQIGGPTAAFIVVVYRTIEHHGYDGLQLATLMAGGMLLIAGFLRLGTYIKYIPYPVTIGFTAGIGLTIMVGQLADLLGLKTGKLPGEFVGKVQALVQALPSLNGAATLIAAAAITGLLLMQRLRPKWPRYLIVVVAASLAVTFLKLEVTTIGTQFGALPNMLSSPSWPVFTPEKFRAVLPDAITIAILAGIESLLSAVVADGMTGRRHRSNMELVAQGIANIVSPLFGGLPATGAIARTATNIRAGASSPVSGMLHAVFLLVFMLVLAPLAAYVPLAVLAAILVMVAWGMSEAHVVGNFLTHASWGDRLVLLSTLLLTVFYDLTLGIEVGVVLGAFKFMHNMSEAVEIEQQLSLIQHDQPDVMRAPRPHFDAPDLPAGVVIFRIHGPFFFGAAAELAKAMDGMRGPARLLILDFQDVPLLDSTGAASLKSVIETATGKGTRVTVVAANARVLRNMERYGVRSPLVFEMAGSIEGAVGSN